MDQSRLRETTAIILYHSPEVWQNSRFSDYSGVKMIRRTKAGLAICPFFTWTSENIEGLGHTEDDVNLIHCIH